MPLYYFSALDQKGLEVQNHLTASNEANAILEVEGMGLVPIELSTFPLKQKSWLKRDIAFGSTVISLKESAELARLLATLFEAKLPIDAILKIPQEANFSDRTKTFMKRAYEQISEGQSFSSIVDQEPRYLSAEFATFIRVGDRANDFGRSLSLAANYFENSLSTRNKVRSALIYPTILVVSSCILIAMMVLFLVPTLAPLFETSGAELPWVFAASVGLQVFLKSWWWLIAISIAGIFFLLLSTAQTTLGNSALARLRERTPFFGYTRFLGQLSADASFISLLTGSGENLPAVFSELSDLRKQDLQGETYKSVHEQLREGGNLVEILSADKYLPSEFTTFAVLAERTNEWEIVFGNLSKMLGTQVEKRTDQFLQLLTPILTAIVGLVIGGLVYTVLNAILGVNDLAF